MKNITYPWKQDFHLTAWKKAAWIALSDHPDFSLFFRKN